MGPDSDYMQKITCEMYMTFTMFFYCFYHKTLHLYFNGIAMHCAPKNYTL